MKAFVRILLIMMMALVLCSCGDNFYNLTEDETELISEYAVDVVLRHGKGTDFRLLANAEQQLKKKRERDAAVEALKEERRKQEEMEQEMEEAAEQGEGGEGEEAMAEPVMPSVSNVSELLGLGDVSIEWMGYNIMDSYAESNGFSMGAAPGNKLLVLSFYTENHSGQDTVLDIFSIHPIFRVGINGANPEVTDTTLLLNDLAMFKGPIAPGAGQELVLVKEIPAADAEGISEVSLTGEVNGTEYSLGSR